MSKWNCEVVYILIYIEMMNISMCFKEILKNILKIHNIITNEGFCGRKFINEIMKE